MQPMPRAFARRLTLSVIGIFLVTMAFFLWIAFRSERTRYLAATFEHLEETASVLSSVMGQEAVGEGTSFSELERRLAESTGVTHRILTTNADTGVSRASEPTLRGTDSEGTYDLGRYGGPEDGMALASGPDGEWYVVSMPAAGAGEHLYLMRSRQGEKELVRQFWAIHGPHVVVTVLLFLLLLRFLGERFVRRPIEQLSAHVDRVQNGEFQTRPEVYPQDEFGWLAERFTAMGLRLEETVENLVRAEKSASAAAVAYRVARGVNEPLANLRRHLAYLDGLSGADPALQSVGRSLRKDLRTLVQAIVQLEELMPVSGTDRGSDESSPHRREHEEGA